MTPTDRVVSVPRERLGRWLDGFAGRHGAPVVSGDAAAVVLDCPDGARAAVAVPFPPLPGPADLTGLLAHVTRDRRVGILLVRKGGSAVGVAEGVRLIRSKIGSGYVQGTTKAGGWSQQRYARRRDNQAAKLYAGAAEVAVTLLLIEPLEAVVTGGDKPAVAAVLADPRLARLVPLVVPRTYPVADPRLRVLQAFPATYLAVSITLNALA
ncbi:MAG: acVLRF1 family peptidyl-tRNA hydrolase [Propionibacteriaceae bacterium]